MKFKTTKSTEDLKLEINKEINQNTLPKTLSGKTGIILSRNSRKCVKRAKNEFKDYSNTKKYTSDRNDIINQLSSVKRLRMNLTVKIN